MRDKKKIYLMGSCRLLKPLRGSMDKMDKYNGGYIYSSSEVIQAFKIMSGSMVVSKDLENYVFYDYGVPEKKLYNISKIEKFIIEISSIKKYIYDDFLLSASLMMRKDDFSEYDILKDIRPIKESEEEMINNFSLIKDITKNKKIIFISHNNMPCLEVRYFINKVLIEWCSRKDNNHTFYNIDTFIKKENNPNSFFRCPKDQKYEMDYNHYSKKGRKKIAKLYGSLMGD
jgi:hypothetical protein